MKKRKQRGTGYKYVDGPAPVRMPEQAVLEAMQGAKLANDSYKFKSLFVREMMDAHQRMMNEVMNEPPPEGIQLSYADMVIVRARQRHMTTLTRKLAGWLAQQMWLCPSSATLRDRCEQKTMEYPFDIRGHVIVAVCILDKLTTPGETT